jgi:hypothetical protein
MALKRCQFLAAMLLEDLGARAELLQHVDHGVRVSEPVVGDG